MLPKFFLRPIPLPLTLFSPTHPSLFPIPSLSGSLTLVSLLSTPTSCHAISPKPLPYGPSLQKGLAPSPEPPQNCPKQCDQDLVDDADVDRDGLLNEDEFTRVFNIAALRVPARDCFALESRLRGHLLNWPRIPNIARVPGDEMEQLTASLLGDSRSGDEEDEDRNLDVLHRRIYGKAERDSEKLSPVLYRERLAKDFNSRGFVKFRNLARMTRPKKKTKDERCEQREENGRKRKGEFAVVEVVEEEDGDGEDWKGLLGDDFKGSRKWKGSTRLLLLDERYAEKIMEELPQAVKVANPNSFGSL